jgi:hypothetical protein
VPDPANGSEAVRKRAYALGARGSLGHERPKGAEGRPCMTTATKKTLSDRASIAGIATRQWLGGCCGGFCFPAPYSSGFSLRATRHASCSNEETPSAAAWKGTHPLGILLMCTGVVALFGANLVLAGYARALRKLDQNNDLEEACRGLWQFVVQALDLIWRRWVSMSGR